MQVLLHQYDMHHSKTAAYHPQANGLTERANQSLKTKLQATLIEHGTDWDNRLPLALFHMNNAVHAITKLIPFKATFGDDARNPSDPVVSTKAGTPPDMSTNYEQQTLVRKRIIEEKVKRHQQSSGKQRNSSLLTKCGSTCTPVNLHSRKVLLDLWKSSKIVGEVQATN